MLIIQTTSMLPMDRRYAYIAKELKKCKESVKDNIVLAAFSSTRTCFFGAEGTIYNKKGRRAEYIPKRSNIFY